MRPFGMEDVEDMERQMDKIPPMGLLPGWSSATMREVLGALKRAWAEGDDIEEHRADAARRLETANEWASGLAGDLDKALKMLVLAEERLAEYGARRPTHGPCCTCQRCGHGHDECRCSLDDEVDAHDALKADYAKLKGERKGDFVPGYRGCCVKDRSPDDDSLWSTHEILATRKMDEEATQQAISCGKAMELIESLIACREELQQVTTDRSRLFAECLAWHALDAKIQVCHDDPGYLGVWAIAQSHLGKYSGPDYVEERAVAHKKAAENERNYGSKKRH
jgi:hypothetical protein